MTHLEACEFFYQNCNVGRSLEDLEKNRPTTAQLAACLWNHRQKPNHSHKDIVLWLEAAFAINRHWDAIDSPWLPRPDSPGYYIMIDNVKIGINVQGTQTDGRWLYELADIGPTRVLMSGDEIIMRDSGKRILKHGNTFVTRPRNEFLEVDGRLYHFNVKLISVSAVLERVKVNAGAKLYRGNNMLNNGSPIDIDSQDRFGYLSFTTKDPKEN